VLGFGDGDGDGYGGSRILNLKEIFIVGAESRRKFFGGRASGECDGESRNFVKDEMNSSDLPKSDVVYYWCVGRPSVNILDRGIYSNKENICEASAR